jgi:hypothetical protein
VPAFHPALHRFLSRGQKSRERWTRIAEAAHTVVPAAYFWAELSIKAKAAALQPRRLVTGGHQSEGPAPFESDSSCDVNRGCGFPGALPLCLLASTRPPMRQFDFGFAAGTTGSTARARASKREADWRRQLARAFVYATERSPEQAEELLVEYERREREGPDFMRQRPGSVIAEAPVVTLDRNERIRLVHKFRALTRRAWVSKETGKHRGVITRTAESVFGALMYLTEKYGRVFPSLEGLAHLAMCCRQSVVTALDDLERLGFVTRIRRIRQVQTPLGFTTRQITNAYRVHEPTSGLGLLATLVFATESNSSTPSAHRVNSLNSAGAADPKNPLAQALARLETLLKKSVAPDGATSSAMK